MLKKRDLLECQELYSLITHPDVFPFVRHKPKSYEEFIFITKQIIEEEDQGKTISRTILDEWGNSIGTINLYDIQDRAGFLGTWLGKPYHGKGYNLLAKETFFNEVFFDNQIDTIFMRVRKENIRSQKAAEKIPYIVNASETRPHIVNQINQNDNGFEYILFEISKDAFTLYTKQTSSLHFNSTQPMEA